MSHILPQRFRSSQFASYDVNGVTTVHVNYDNSANTGVNDVISGQKNPNWKQVIAKGGNATSPYTRQEGKLTPPRHTMSGSGWTLYAGEKTWYASRDTSRRVFNPVVLLMTGDDTTLRDQALARIKRKLASQSSSTNVVVPMVELRELRGLVRSLAKSGTGLVNTLLEARDGKRFTGRSLPQFASDAWLTWSFGISPMIGEANSISAAIAAFLNKKDSRIRLEGFASKNWKSGSAQNQATASIGEVLRYGHDAEHSLTYKYTGGFDLSMKSGNNYGLGPQFGLEFGAIIPTAWELVPYSWLVDYFTTVGAYLDDTFTSPSGTTKYLSLGKKYTCRITSNGTYIPNKSTTVEGHYINSQSHTPQIYVYSSFERTSLTTLPHVGLRFKTMDEMGLNAVNRLLNLTSLLLKR